MSMFFDPSLPFIELGVSDCYECESRGTKVLRINRKGIFSECKRCGFGEWEWTFGDKHAYLEYLAERYGVSMQELVTALKRFM